MRHSSLVEMQVTFVDCFETTSMQRPPRFRVSRAPQKEVSLSQLYAKEDRFKVSHDLCKAYAEFLGSCDARGVG